MSFSYTIVADTCEGIADCIPVCLVECIHWADGRTNAKGTKYVYIDAAVCIDCGVCLSVCPIAGAILAEWKPEFQRPDRRRSLLQYLRVSVADHYSCGPRTQIAGERFRRGPSHLGRRAGRGGLYRPEIARLLSARANVFGRAVGCGANPRLRLIVRCPPNQALQPTAALLVSGSSWLTGAVAAAELGHSALSFFETVAIYRVIFFSIRCSGKV